MEEGMSDLVTIPRQEYEDLVDARDHALAMRDVATGAMETLTEAEMDAYLSAPSPLAFWRRRRGLTQAALAAGLGVSQPYLAQIETGQRTGDVRLYARMAKALRVRMEDLVPEE
jgi:DNA-binding XRE family transcriptional regulator